MPTTCPSKPWRVILAGPAGFISETDHTSEAKAYAHLRYELAESEESLATTAKVMQWADGRWGHFETVHSADLLVDKREQPKPEPATVFVAVWNGRPIAAGSDLDAVKAAAVARESQYLSAPPEYRWDAHLDGGYWDLMQLNRSTRRWNRTSTFISTVPIVDAPAS